MICSNYNLNIMCAMWVITGADGPVYQGDAVGGTPSSPSSSSSNPPCLHQLCGIDTCRGKYWAQDGLNYTWAYAVSLFLFRVKAFFFGCSGRSHGKARALEWFIFLSDVKGTVEEYEQ